MYVFGLLCAGVLIVLGLLFLRVGIHIFFTPEHIWKAHMRLEKAVRNANLNSVSDEDRRIIDDAEKMGMVNCGFSVADGGGMRIHYYRTKHANALFWDREYPTVADYAAEMEEFEIPRQIAELH